MRSSLAATLAFLVASCTASPNADGTGGPTDPGGAGASGPVELGQIGFAFLDGRTALGTTPPSASVCGQTGPMLGALSLRTWPELAPVEATIETTPGPSCSALSLVPRSPLTDRWYVASVGALPTGFRVVTTDFVLPDGTFGHRFRPDSVPSVLAIRFCRSSETVDKLIVDLSEPIQPATNAASVVTVRYAGEASALCETWDGTSPTGEYAIGGRCPRIDGTRDVTVAIGDGLVAVSTKSVPAGTWTFVPGSFAGSECATFRP